MAPQSGFRDANRMKQVIAIAVACSLLLLPGCIPHLRKPEPGLNRLPEGFRGNTSPDNSAKVEIDEFYQDPMLHFRFTEYGAGILDDPYLPGQHFSNPFGNYLGRVNLNWQIDIYRQLRNARDAGSSA